jgi:hypothetical protein
MFEVLLWWVMAIKDGHDSYHCYHDHHSGQYCRCWYHPISELARHDHVTVHADDADDVVVVAAAFVVVAASLMTMTTMITMIVEGYLLTVVVMNW